MMTSGTPGAKFYNEQLELLFAGKTDELIDRHYTDDAVLVSFDFTVRGAKAIKEHFGGYLKGLGGMELNSTNKFTEGPDFIFFEADVITGAYGPVTVFDSFVMKDGKISYHFTGVK